MSQSLVTPFAAKTPRFRPASKDATASRSQTHAAVHPIRHRRAGTLLASRAKLKGTEILVAVRNMVGGAQFENVCLVVAGVPYAPNGTGVVRPGNTSSLVELPSELCGSKAAVYFELAMGAHRIPLLTGEVFAFSPGAVCVVTIADHTRAHNPPIEIEGAVARLVRAREAATGT
jgi:hypothetical protein